MNGTVIKVVISSVPFLLSKSKVSFGSQGIVVVVAFKK